jgi:hypothetical protein
MAATVVAASAWDSPRIPSAGRSRGSCGASSLEIDTSAIRDPRLRTMLGMDLQILDRARTSSDFRLAAMALGSVFEAVVVDLAMQKRSEFDLQGTPDSWPLKDLVARLSRTRFTGPDRNTLFHLLRSRLLFQPAQQLTNPLVVTKLSVDKMLDFVQRFLVESGLSGR